MRYIDEKGKKIEIDINAFEFFNKLGTYCVCF